MKTWKFEITMKVADSWIADGFDASQKERIEEIQEAITGMLPYAYDHEIDVKVKITKSPEQKEIVALQNGEAEIKD